MDNMQSILLYLAVFIVSYALIRYGVGAKSRLAVFIGLGIIIALGFFRYGLGIDYASYLELYGYHGAGIELNPEVSYHAGMIEPLFVWLARLSYVLTNTPLLYLGIPWIATVLLVYFGLRKLTRNQTPARIAMAWFTLLPIMTALGFNQVRQTLAAALLFYAFHFLLTSRRTRVIKYLLFASLAAISHFSSIFIALTLLVIGLFLGKKEKKFKKRVIKTTLVSIAIMTVLIIASISLKDTLLSQFADAKYIREFYRLLLLESGVSGLLFGFVSFRPENIIVLIIFLMPMLLFFKGKYDGDRRVLLACATGLIISALSLFVNNGERLAQYYIFFAPVVMISIVGTRYNVRAIYSTIVFITIMIFGWQGVTHYDTIFSRDVDLNLMAQRRIRPLYSQVACLINPGECNDDKLYDLDTSRSWLQYAKDDLWRLK